MIYIFPFQKESLIIAPEHMENFYKVISKEHIDKNKRKHVDISAIISTTASVTTICNRCELSGDTVLGYNCSSCSNCLHIECSPHNWKSTTNEDGCDVYTCYGCFSAL